MQGSKNGVVELADITKQFGDIEAVDSVDLTVESGELLTLLGPSGCGKTTTLRMVAGFEVPTNGQVLLNGEDVSDIPPYHRDTGMVFQRYALFPHMTVWDNIAFGLKMQNVPKAEIEERIENTLSMVQLPDLGDRYPAELSGGQQQRVAFARALAIEPSVLLLDEPLSNLDKKLREEMQMEILRLHEQLDTTMIYVTHNQEEALTLSDRMAVMNDGTLHQVGTPEEVYNRPANEFVADFIGDANLFEGTLTELEPDAATVQLDSGDSIRIASNSLPDSVTVGNNPDSVTAGNNSEVGMVIRPEKIRISDEKMNGRNSIPGEVTNLTYLGEKIDYYIRVGDKEVQATEQNERSKRWSVGDTVTLSFDTETPVIHTIS